MRRLASLCLGLALAAPTLARAQGPDHKAFGNPLAGQVRQEQAQGSTTHYGGHVCEKCASQLPKRIPADGPNAAPPVFVEGCAACGTASGTTIAGLPPGTIILGPGETLANVTVNGEAPGVAYVGGPASAEPAPIGVMRTDYRPDAGAPSAASPFANPGAGPWAAQAAGSAMPYGQPPLSHSMSYPGHKRPHVLSRMLGLPNFRALGAQREARQRAAHAAISYGQPGQAPGSLPSSMVYGQR
jgi:hypothetical protein